MSDTNTAAPSQKQEAVWTPGTRARIIFDAILVAIAIGYSVLALKLGVGTAAEPGSGQFPLAAGLVMVVCFGIDLIGQLLLQAKNAGTAGYGRLSLRAVAVVGSILVYYLFSATLGYMLTTFLVVVILLFSLGNRTWWKVLLIALASAVISYWLFTQLLGVSLPHGVLGIGW